MTSDTTETALEACIEKHLAGIVSEPGPQATHGR